ncbi:hypothetical protein [Clostridioides difficile]|uniref:hypothetical protein n=1 Tax=Clostridioides difficile TaxID=1496 RepID=UPI00093AF4CC|nr:hypothetical protein [Clostridioides difficile]AWH83453.1 hypothetical protein DDG63_20680 [Clostridioides difficile]EGT4846792.1 hypothetical protein [Clostridioides difficile]EGT5015155.1 hypothetical protein [Clostridioides difficile]EJX3365426.1 hypothetical protein [Clostridioides difficile]EJX3377949.1 hypothetical protein [Clostridioides difficile]
MSKFIYAFSEDDKKLLMEKGYRFICENKLNNKTLYVFENKSKLINLFSNEEMKRFIFTSKIRF